MKRQKVIAETRKVWRVGGSLAITLPAEFVHLHGICKGDDLAIVANHILKVVPMPEERTEHKGEQNSDS